MVPQEEKTCWFVPAFRSVRLHECLGDCLLWPTSPLLCNNASILRSSSTLDCISYQVLWCFIIHPSSHSPSPSFIPSFIHPYLWTPHHNSCSCPHHSSNRCGRQQRRRGKKVKEGVLIGTTLHERWPTRLLQDGRGGRGRCVNCYARAPVPPGKSKRKTKMHNGDTIPNVSFACNKCRPMLAHHITYLLWRDLL